MTTSLNTELDVLRAVSKTVSELEVAMKRLRRFRDSEIIRLRQSGHSAIRLATAAQLTRHMIYLIINAPDDAEEESDFDFAGFAEHLQELWATAEREWEAHDYVGTPDDYFPLGEVVDAR